MAIKSCLLFFREDCDMDALINKEQDLFLHTVREQSNVTPGEGNKGRQFLTVAHGATSSQKAIACVL